MTKTIDIVDYSRIMLFFSLIWWVPFGLSTQKRTENDKDAHNGVGQSKKRDFNLFTLKLMWFLEFFFSLSHLSFAVIPFVLSITVCLDVCTVFFSLYLMYAIYTDIHRNKVQKIRSVCDGFIAIRLSVHIVDDEHKSFFCFFCCCCYLIE